MKTSIKNLENIVENVFPLNDLFLEISLETYKINFSHYYTRILRKIKQL